MAELEESQAIDDELDAQLARAQELRDRCLERSALRIVEEVRRAARAHRRLLPCLRANFHVMNGSQSQLDPALGREAAIESIALLESADRAREFQADYSEGAYASAVQWMSACAYDNLAVAVARMQGFNSDGMQACIADGISICRRTGKLQCVTCFREYATEVLMAGDDLQMALHHARANAAKPAGSSPHDRRWVGALDEADILLMAGLLAPALEAGRRAAALAGGYHNPMNARLRTRLLLRTILLLSGRAADIDRELAEHLPLPPGEASPPEGEHPENDLRQAMVAAMEASLRGEHDAATGPLTEWDRRLTERGVITLWFEVRLRLIAAWRFAGAAEKTAGLARQLEAKARTARDFLTLRRLKLMTDGKLPASPFPAAGPFSSGPFAPAPAGEAPAPSGPAGAATPAAAVHGPLFPAIDAIWKRFSPPADGAAAAPVNELQAHAVRDLLAIPPAEVTHPDDAGRLLHLAGFTSQSGAQPEAMWEWANRVAAGFPQDGTIMNLLAALGDRLRLQKDSPLAGAITVEAIESLFRQSLDLSSNGPANFARAGSFYLNTQNLARAEQCLARASRLDRRDAWVALRLAELYTRSDRPTDALAVLDLCIREGGETREVLWEAAMQAIRLQRHEPALTYLARFEAVAPGQPWTLYYRAVTLLDSGKPREAQEAIEQEARRIEADELHLTAIRAGAAAALGHSQALRQCLTDAGAATLHEIKILSPSGISNALSRLWRASEALPAEPDGSRPLRRAIEDLRLVSGLTSDDMFLPYRRAFPKAPGLKHFIVTVDQPLDERWQQTPGRLATQQEWTRYHVTYGVLAPDEAEASRVALEWQQRCFPLAATVASADTNEKNYHDHPGVTWRSYPEPQG